MTVDAELLSGFRMLALRKHVTALDAALLVNQLLHPAVSVASVRREVSMLVPGPDVPAWQHLLGLGFRGDEANYHDVANSRIDQVLKRRLGIPITLAVLLITIAEAQDKAAAGINAPGHFLVRIDGRMIDPFAMRPLDVAGEAEVAEPAQIALRMLNNIKQIFVGSGESLKALDAVDCQLAVCEGSQMPEMLGMLLLEKGEYWRTIGALELALEAFEQAEAHAIDQKELALVCRRRIKQLRAAPSKTLH